MLATAMSACLRAGLMPSRKCRQSYSNCLLCIITSPMTTTLTVSVPCPIGFGNGTGYSRIWADEAMTIKEAAADIESLFSIRRQI